MKDIEVLAIGLFERYARSRTGKHHDWNYLARDRQIEWMEEVVIYNEHILEQIRGRLKPPPGPLPGDATYGIGYKDGLRVKYQEVMAVLDSLDADLKNQLDLIKNPPQE